MKRVKKSLLLVLTFLTLLVFESCSKDESFNMEEKIKAENNYQSKNTNYLNSIESWEFTDKYYQGNYNVSKVEDLETEDGILTIYTLFVNGVEKGGYNRSAF